MQKQLKFAIKMESEAWITEAAALVADGVSVKLPVGGNSMLPFIRGGHEQVILAKPCPLTKGKVVLAWVDGCRYVIHRIERIDGQRVTLMGDGNLQQREHCTVDDVKALVTHVVDARGKYHDLYTPARRMAATLWYAFLPVRRYLLKFVQMGHSLFNK